MKPTALHERIRSDIEARILSGEARPGDRIPSEIELMEQYRCARMTVNKALSALSHAGLVDRRKRAGTVVAERRTESMVLDIPDLAIEVERRGEAYRYELIERSVRKPGRDDPDEAELAGRGDLLCVRGVHFADDRPLAYEERLISLEAVPEAWDRDFVEEAPGSWLLRHIPWTEAENRIGASAAGDGWAGLLGVAVGSACLTLRRRTWRSGRSITFVRQQFVADRYELVARFGPAQRAQA